MGRAAELIAPKLAAGRRSPSETRRCLDSRWGVDGPAHFAAFRGMDDWRRRSNILAWWEELEINETFIPNKLPVDRIITVRDVRNARVSRRGRGV